MRGNGGSAGFFVARMPPTGVPSGPRTGMQIAFLFALLANEERRRDAAKRPPRTPRRVRNNIPFHACAAGETFDVVHAHVGAGLGRDVGAGPRVRRTGRRGLPEANNPSDRSLRRRGIFRLCRALHGEIHERYAAILRHRGEPRRRRRRDRDRSGRHCLARRLRDLRVRHGVNQHRAGDGQGAVRSAQGFWSPSASSPRSRWYWR